ncbi:OmpP1/FadL family transporter [Camelimonas lactis]|uniref:Long-chain fatty acid transport protein n=1 Tax=Camelimonas lactis TaxID=659006 RepID=A0A4R2GQF6_9HYPH|nr:outer membrane protein transport protein [Camelimonas lactis]TCO11814.1 long-chain fatty acid transport protein [Camelimonas lactis]
MRNTRQPAHRRFRIRAALLAGCVMLASSGAAMAGGFALREQSAAGLGLSFAGVAAGGGGLSAGYWNPAIITGFGGFTTASSYTAIAPYANITADPATPTWALGPGRDIGLSGVLASSVAAYQINDRVWIGVSAGAPFGLSTKSDYTWSGQVYGRTSRVLGMSVSPMIAVKATDWLSLGVGVTAQYMDVRLTQAAGVAPAATGVALDADGWGVGYMLGATITPGPNTTIGIGFRSAVHQDVTGSATGPFIPGAGPLSLKAKAPLNTPEVLTVGVRQKLNEQWTVLAGFEWTNWSRLGYVPVRINGVVSEALPFAYKDGYMASAGVEYAWSPQLTLRAGLGYEWSPVSNRVRDVRLPDTNRLSASVGLGWRLNDALSLDVSYAHLFGEPASIRIVPGHPQYVGLPWVGSAKAHVDIVSLGVNYRFGTPASIF